MTDLGARSATFRSTAMAGPAIMLLGMFMFALNDAMGKWLLTNYGLGQVILIRSLAALLILIPLLWQGVLCFDIL